MIRYLTVPEVVFLHQQVIAASGGSHGCRDLGSLDSALAQPRMTFGGEDLYQTLVEKAAAMGFSIIKNHPFVDGNKRVGHAAMEIFLHLNGFKLVADVDDQENTILSLAAGTMSRESFSAWLQERIQPRSE
jgi:death on curing protein